MIFVDSNIPMYLVGTPHPNRDRAAEALVRLRAEHEVLVTDVEAYQEILHRFSSIARHHLIDEGFKALDDIVDHVFTFGLPEIRAARELVQSAPGL